MNNAKIALGTMCVTLLCAGTVCARAVGDTSVTPEVTPAPMTIPAMGVPLTANPAPMSFATGALGSWYVTGAVTGLLLAQNHPAPGDRDTRGDLGNAQVFIQKPSGQLQFFVQVGTYAIPSLGSAYLSANRTTSGLFGNVPQAFIKYVPNDHFSIMAGKLPTLVGSESTYTFQNMNIERGLLWNQENAVNRGVQATYSQGPITASVAVNDGFYSSHYNWVFGSLGYVIDENNAVSLVVGGNTDKTARSTLATPLLQNNSRIINFNYTHLDGAWTIAPSLQYTRVPANSALGIAHSAATTGVALLANYAFNAKFSLASRAEYISSTGSAAKGTPSLLYGPGSKAWSLTLTPTWQHKRLFVRAEVSWVKASNSTPGFAFGQTLDRQSQSRVMLETGLLF